MQGGADLPDIKFYYQTTLLESILQYWNFDNKLSWQLEQEETEESLVNWILTKQECELPRSSSLIPTMLCKFWKKVYRIIGSYRQEYHYLVH